MRQHSGLCVRSVRATLPVMTILLNIDVPDAAQATTFYTAAFGLTVGRRFGTDFVELLGWPAPP